MEKKVSKKQMNLDTKKWLDSIKNGRDMCGEYDYCSVCDRTKENPCEKALIKFAREKKAYNAKMKFNAEGKELNYRATILEK